MTEIERARSLLSEEVNLVIVRGSVVTTYSDRGIKALLSVIKDNKWIMEEATIADKVVGKAAAFLIACGNAKEVYAEVLSSGAADVLRKCKIPFSFGILTEKIVNREGNGICPTESAVQNIDDVNEAYSILQDKFKTIGL